MFFTLKKKGFSFIPDCWKAPTLETPSRKLGHVGDYTRLETVTYKSKHINMNLSFAAALLPANHRTLINTFRTIRIQN